MKSVCATLETCLAQSAKDEVIILAFSNPAIFKLRLANRVATGFASTPVTR